MTPAGRAIDVLLIEDDPGDELITREAFDLNVQVLVRRYIPPRRSTTMSPVISAVILRTMLCTPSRLHGVLKAHPLVWVAVGDA